MCKTKTSNTPTTTCTFENTYILNNHPCTLFNPCASNIPSSLGSSSSSSSKAQFCFSTPNVAAGKETSLRQIKHFIWEIKHKLILEQESREKEGLITSLIEDIEEKEDLSTPQIEDIEAVLEMMKWKLVKINRQIKQLLRNKDKVIVEKNNVYLKKNFLNTNTNKSLLSVQSDKKCEFLRPKYQDYNMSIETKNENVVMKENKEQFKAEYPKNLSLFCGPTIFCGLFIGFVIISYTKFSN